MVGLGWGVHAQFLGGDNVQVAGGGDVLATGLAGGRLQLVLVLLLLVPVAGLLHSQQRVRRRVVLSR